MGSFKCLIRLRSCENAMELCTAQVHAILCEECHEGVRQVSISPSEDFGDWQLSGACVDRF